MLTLRLKAAGLLLLGAAALVLSSPAARAAVLIDYTAGNAIATFVPGESFLIPGAGSYNNIGFNFYSAQLNSVAINPTAAGTLYILNQEYLGNPDALSAATPGFVTASTGISGGVYQFSSGNTLLGFVTYYAYSDAAMMLSGANPGSYPDGILYDTNTTNSPFAADPGVDANFRVQGTFIPGSTAPEPASCALLALPALGLLIRRRAR